MTESGDSGRDAAWPQATDFTRPAIARVYDYLLGGKDHMPPDRRVGDRLIAAGPAVLRARENRKFLERAVRFLAYEAGIRQFLDIGVGYPVPGGNVHEIAQAIAPQSRVAYVDNDMVVLAHARALMTSTTEGRMGCDQVGPAVRRSRRAAGQPGNTGHPGLRGAGRGPHHRRAALHPGRR